MAELTLDQKKAIAKANARLRGKQVERLGTVLPIERHVDGGWDWNMEAGIPGAVWRGVSSVRDAYEGNITPDEMIPRAMEAASLMSPSSVASRSGSGILGAPITKKARVKPPTAKELFGEGSKNFNAMRETGVEYSVSAVKKWADEILYKLDDAGFDLDGATAKKVKELLNPPDGAVSAPIRGLAKLRRRLTKIGANPGEEREASRIVRESLDAFLADPPADGVVAGRASDAARLSKEANANWAAGKRRADVEKIIGSKSRRAAASNSGQNVGNSLRQGTSSLLDSEKRIRGFSDPEKAALETVAQGTVPRNAMRNAANRFGGGGGWGGTMTSGLGGVAGGYMFDGNPYAIMAGAMIPPTVGGALKTGENALTRRALQQAADLVSTRSPLFGKMQAKASPDLQMSPGISAAQRAAMVKALGEQKQKLKESKAKNKVIKMKELDEEMRRLLLLRLPPNEA